MLFAEVNPEIRCALTDGGQRMVSRQTILHMGKWAHPKAPGGILNIDEKRLDEIVKNFKARVGLAGAEMPAHIGHTEHVDDRAVAWAKIEKVADEKRPGCHKLVAISEHTDPKAFSDIRNKSYRFVSPTLVFGYKDRSTGKVHDTVLRNFAYTNYPFLQGMGDAEVVNMSEVQLAELSDLGVGDDSIELAGDTVLPDGTVLFDGTVALTVGEIDATGGGSAGNPNMDNLPAGYDLQSLPIQCTTCARLGNDCPFVAKDAGADVALKQAAAQSGNCPQYVESDKNQPGGGGGKDAAASSPADNRGFVPMSEPDATPKLLGNMTTHMHILKALVKHGPLDGGTLTGHVTRRMAEPYATYADPQDDKYGVSGHLNGLQKAGLVKNTALPGKVASYEATPEGKNALLAHIKANPMNAVKLSDGVKLSDDVEMSDDGVVQNGGLPARVLGATLNQPGLGIQDIHEHICSGDGHPAPNIGQTKSALAGLIKSGHIQRGQNTLDSKDSYRATPKGKQAYGNRFRDRTLDSVNMSESPRKNATELRDAMKLNTATKLNESNPGQLSDIHMHILKAALKHGSPKIERSALIEHVGQTMPESPGASAIQDGITNLQKAGHLQGFAGVSGHQTYYSPTPKGKTALLAHIKADPMNAVKLSALPGKVNNMPTKSTEALMLRVAQMDAEEQTRFVTALGDKHGLPAVALTAVDAIFKAGQSTAVQLGDAIDAYNTTVALSEPGESPEMPAALADADLSDMVLVSRAALREMVETVAASGRTEVQLADTTVVEGAPADGKGKTILSQVAAIEDPRAAAKELDRLVAEGKLTPSRS